MFVVGVPAALGVWLIFRLSDLDAVLGTHDLGLMVGPGIGLFVGVSVGLIMEYSAAPIRSGGQKEGSGRRRRLWFDRSRFNAPLAMMAGCISGLAVGCVLAASSLVLALVVGTVVGEFVHWAAGLASVRGASRETANVADASRYSLERLMSRFSPLVALACGLPVMAALAFAPPSHNPSAHSALSGPVTGVVFGISLAVAFGLLDGFTRPGAGASVPISPRDALQRDFRASLQVGLPFGLAVGLVGGVGDGAITGWADGLLAGSVIGAVGVLVSGVAVSEQWRTRLAFVQLWNRRRQVPINGLRFLDNACKLEVLRTAGPVYQFRHALLQDKLAGRAKAGRPGESAAAAPAHEVS